MSHRSKISIGALIFILLSVASSYFAYREEQGNFHAITPGEAYRSAILDRDELERYIKKYHVKSIINLLGEKPCETWYQQEIEVAAEQHLEHYDLSLPTSHEPSEEDARKLVEIFEAAPRPVLIHCKAGADRSGLAAAIWQVIVDKKTKSEAKGQLSIRYGHVPIVGRVAMDRFFEKWNPVSD